MNASLRRIGAALVLSCWFIIAVVRSGWQTACIIVRSPKRVTPGFVDYAFAPMSNTAATLLACLICLTPGTTVVELTPGEGRMRLHLLGIRQQEEALREIRERFEPLVRTIFVTEAHV